MPSADSADVVLTKMESNVTVISATTGSLTIPVLDVSATAVYLVPTSTMKNVFQFESHSFNMNDVSSQDMRYYVDMSNSWPSNLVLNPANFMLDYSSNIISPPDTPSFTFISNGAISLTSTYYNNDYQRNKVLLKHDFLRYLALKLFNSYDGTDLFNNEDDLVTNINYICDGSAEGHTWYDISSALHNVSTNGSSPDLSLNTVTGEYYLTNDHTTEDNLTREILLQMLSVESTRNRYSDISGTDTRQPILFEDYDSINFILTVNPAPLQNELTGVDTIPGRNYKLTIYMVPDGEDNNTIPID